MKIRALLSMFAALAIAMLLGFAQQQTPAEQALAVIVHPKNPTTGLTTGQLRDYFLIERAHWKDKLRAELHLPPKQSETREILLKHVYRMSEADLRKHWVRMIFRGTITDSPSVAPSAAKAIQLVRDNPGAFSVILASEVTAEVRVLPIDGKLPGEKGYPLVGTVKKDVDPVP